MSKAVKCPVCEGIGEIVVEETTANVGGFSSCHGCNGKGWIQIRDDSYPSWEEVLPHLSSESSKAISIAMGWMNRPKAP